MKQINCNILLSLVALFLMTNVYAQEFDSLEIINTEYDSILRSDDQEMDVLFYKHSNDVHINNLGTFGSPFYYPTAFFLKRKQLIKPKNQLNYKLYNLSGFKPFTNITYINASRKEQHFYVKHIQEFGSLIKLEFDFRKISSPGAFTNQEANNTFFNGSLKYQSLKENYSIVFSSGLVRNFSEENGGLLDDTDYEFGFFEDERNYSVNLENSNSFIKKYNYELEQRLDIFRTKTDSASSNIFYLKHLINYYTGKRVFFDNDSNSRYYKNIYLDPVSSIDSVFDKNLSNTGSIGMRKNLNKFEFFGAYDQINYNQNFGIDSSFTNLYVGLSGSIVLNGFEVDAIGRYAIDGYNADDIEAELSLKLEKKKYLLTGGLSYFVNEADLKLKNYYSNHFRWDNNSFNKQSVIGGNFDFKLKKAQLLFKSEVKVLNNTFYFDSLAIASQDNNDVMIASFLLAKDYRILNFHFRTALIYQLTSDELLFPLPDIVGRQVIYYQKQIFKDAMKFQIGLGFSYSTNYYGYSYMPAIGEFINQGGSTEMGFYPRLDLFINTQLKRAQIFLKYEHFNAGRSLQKSYITVGYPSMNKSLKFGVSWNMFD